MPILTVELVSDPERPVPDHLASVIADRAAEIFGTPPGRTWVRLHELPFDAYAENGISPQHRPRPVFVSVLKASLPPTDQLARECTELTAQVADACGRTPENVHVIYEPPALDRIAFGGRLLRHCDKTNESILDGPRLRQLCRSSSTYYCQ